MKWHAVQTKYKKESHAEVHLKNQNFVVFNPTIMISSRSKGKLKVAREALFPGYLFVGVNSCEQNMASISSTRGVIGIVKFGDKPAELPDGFVDAVSQRLQQDQPAANAEYQCGDKVLITEGTLSGLNAIFQAKNSEERCYILLDFLGSKTAVSIQSSFLKKAV